MPAWLSRWLSPPVFPEDEAKTYRARILFTVIATLILFDLITSLGLLFARYKAAPILSIALVLLVLCLVNYFLVRRGSIRHLDLLVLVELYLVGIALIAARGTIRAPLTAILVYFIIVAGALFEQRGVWVSTLASSLAVAGLGLAEYYGLFPEADLTLTATQWITYTVLFAITGSMSLLISQVTRDALRRSQSEIQERIQTEERYQQALDELQKRTAELSAANQDLERASRLKSEFLASMSHELRTPLTGILGLSESMQMQIYGPLNERQVKSLRNIESSGKHLLELINDILDLSRLEAGRLALEPDLVLVSEICQASLKLTKGLAEEKGMLVEYANAMPTVRIYADARRVKQMLANLLSNAIKFTPQGGRLGLEVNETTDGQAVELAVWDEGIGIKPEDLNRLFKPFVQLDSGLTRQYSGTGLGLSLVSGLAELHCGSVRVESTPGKGSRFTITLPWWVADHQPDGGQLPVSASPAGALAADAPAAGAPADPALADPALAAKAENIKEGKPHP